MIRTTEKKSPKTIEPPRYGIYSEVMVVEGGGESIPSIDLTLSGSGGEYLMPEGRYILSVFDYIDGWIYEMIDREDVLGSHFVSEASLIFGEEHRAILVKKLEDESSYLN